MLGKPCVIKKKKVTIMITTTPVLHSPLKAGGKSRMCEVCMFSLFLYCASGVYHHHQNMDVGFVECSKVSLSVNVCAL